MIEQKNKFGSTPLFNIPPAPPVTSATTRPKLGPPPPTSFSCHEVKNSAGYAIPNGGVVAAQENFYAATDIVLKVRIGPAAVFFFFLLCTTSNLVVEIRLKYISFLNTIFLSLQVHLVSSSESSSFFQFQFEHSK